MRLLVLITVIFALKTSYAQDFVNQKKEEDIIYVTARKKNEKINDVPQSITSFSAEQIENSGFESLRDLTDFSANVDIIGSKSGRYVTPYIRGLGNQDLNLPEEVSVGFYLDGVPMPRYAIDNELLDLSGVEVLRGPQGTLFGRNSQAGAINLLSKVPGKEQINNVSVKVGNLGLKSLKGSTQFSGKKWRNRLSLKAMEEDGYIEDRVLNKDLGDEQSQSFFNSFFYDLPDNGGLYFKVGGIQRKGSDPLIIDRMQPDYPISGQGFEPQFDTEMVTSSVQYKKKQGSSELTLTTSFNYYDFDIRYDESDYFITYDYLRSQVGTTLANRYINDPDVLNRGIKEYQRQNFNEVLFHKTAGEWDWTTGANFSYSEYRLISSVNTFTGGSFVTRNQDVRLRTKNYAVFGDGTYHFNKKLSLSLGLRFNYDDKEFDSLHSSTNLSYYKQDSEAEYKDFNGRFALNYKWKETRQYYFNFARGYQSGGFPSFQFNNYNAIAADQDPYEKSHSHSFELGARLWFFKKRLQVSSALFYHDIFDKQVRLKNPTNNLSFYANIDTLVLGGETEISLKLNEDLTFGLNVGYTNPRFKEKTINGITTISEEGARLANIPFWSGSAFIHYEPYWSRFNVSPFLRAQYQYKGHRFGDNTNRTVMGSYGLLDFRAGFIAQRFRVTLFATNLFDKVYETQAYYYSGLNRDVSTPGMPRRFGAEVGITF